MEEALGWNCGSNKPQDGWLARKRPTQAVSMAEAPEWMCGSKYLGQDSWMEEAPEWMVEWKKLQTGRLNTRSPRMVMWIEEAPQMDNGMEEAPIWTPASKNH